MSPSTYGLEQHNPTLNWHLNKLPYVTIQSRMAALMQQQTSAKATLP